MPVFLRMVNHDSVFMQLKTEPIIINHIDTRDQKALKSLNDWLLTTYSKDTLELVPTCDCKYYKGDFYVNQICPVCFKPCLQVTEQPLESVLWFKRPDGVDALLNPAFWLIVSPKLTESGVNILEWLTNPMFKPSKEVIAIERLKAEGVKRGLNYFYRNFDEIMRFLVEGKVFANRANRKRDGLLDFIEINRKALFSEHIPFPSRLLFVREKSPMGTYRDKIIDSGLDAVRTICSIENSVRKLSVEAKEAKTIIAIRQLAEYYYNFFDKNLGKKEGWFRKHKYGARSHFSFRAVATSISVPHHREDVHLPWTLSVMLFSLHLRSKLLKLGYTPNEALRIIHEGAVVGSDVLKSLFNELLSESPKGKIPCLIGRNPTLTRGSIQQLYISKIKDDAADNTISLSVLVLKAFNCDFDGDCLNGLLIHDEYTADRLSRHLPHFYSMELNEPWKLSGFMELPAPITTNLAIWLKQ